MDSNGRIEREPQVLINDVLLAFIPTRLQPSRCLMSPSFDISINFPLNFIWLSRTLYVIGSESTSHRPRLWILLSLPNSCTQHNGIHAERAWQMGMCGTGVSDLILAIADSV